MINWYKKVVFENYANFKGRARRSEYWYFVLMNLIIAIITAIIDKSLGLKFGTNTLYSLAVFIPGLAVAVRRLHDIGKSGKLLLFFYLIMIALAIVMVFSGLSVFMAGMNPDGLSNAGIGALGMGFFIPLIIIIAMSIYMLVLFCTNGDEGPNKYGPDPKGVGEEIHEIGAE
jgi:uncharacterized membrane protein YhaH (DUF805 family)